MPLMFIVGYEQIIIVQILTPLKKDIAILIGSFCGALMSLILNFIIVPRAAAVGSSLVWFVSELVVLVSAQYFTIKYVSYSMPFLKLFKAISSLLPAILICLLLNTFGINNYIVFILGGCIVFVSYFLIQLHVFNNEMICHFSDSICNRFVKIKK